MSDIWEREGILDRLAELSRGGYSLSGIAAKLSSEFDILITRGAVNGKLRRPGATTASTWTEARVEQMKKLWADGLSASQIATALGGGVTRMAVLGKVHRANLPIPRRPRRPNWNVRPNDGTLPAPYVAPIPISEPEYLGPVGDFPERGACKWIKGDPSTSEWQCCGHKAMPELPYCEFHSCLAYNTQDTRRAREESRRRDLEGRRVA